MRTVFISGTDHGLGEALATLWADRGVRVFAGVLTPTTEPEPRARGGWVRRVQLDVASDASVTKVAALVAAETDHLDVLVNNAGILGDIDHSAFEALDFDQMLKVYNVNALGSLRLTNALLPLLMAGGEKLLVNISSEAGSLGLSERDRWYGYAMAKAALNMQSVLVNNLVREKGGRVLVLHPGHVRTLMRGVEDASAPLTPDEAAQRVLDNLERVGPPTRHPPFWGPEGELLPW